MKLADSGYGPLIDGIIYGHATSAGFTRADWLALAIAALDQAGAPAHVQKRLELEIKSLVFCEPDDDFERFADGEQGDSLPPPPPPAPFGAVQ